MTVKEMRLELRDLPECAEVLVEHECEGVEIAPIVRVDRILHKPMPVDGGRVIITTRS